MVFHKKHVMQQKTTTKNLKLMFFQPLKILFTKQKNNQKITGVA